MTYLPNELSVNLYALCMLLFIYITSRRHGDALSAHLSPSGSRSAGIAAGKCRDRCAGGDAWNVQGCVVFGLSAVCAAALTGLSVFSLQYLFGGTALGGMGAGHRRDLPARRTVHSALTADRLVLRYFGRWCMRAGTVVRCAPAAAGRRAIAAGVHGHLLSSEPGYLPVLFFAVLFAATAALLAAAAVF